MTTPLSPWGYAAVRAYYPENMGGPFGSPGNPLPSYGTFPMNTTQIPYKPEPTVALLSCSFGQGRQLTPGGVSTRRSGGYFYGRKGKSNRKRKRRRKSKSKNKRKYSRRKVNNKRRSYKKI